MTRSLLIAVDGIVYKPVPPSIGSVGFDIGLKLYANEYCAVYNGDGKYPKTMRPFSMGYNMEYADTDPSNGQKYVIVSGRNWKMINGELYVEKDNYGWLKASEHHLTVIEH